MAYTPPNSRKCSDLKGGQVRIGLMGYPFTGKTWSALTFPNPVVLNLDNKLGAHSNREDVIVLPFSDGAFCDQYSKRVSASHPPNVRNAVKKWLQTEGLKLEADQTLVIDSWTMLQNWFDIQETIEPQYSVSTGKVDEFAAWASKKQFSRDICEYLKLIRCNYIIVTFHETDERDKKSGKVTGKVRPLMEGSFKDQVSGHFTDWFRQHAIDKLKEPNKSDSEVIGTSYLWQTQSDSIADCGTGSLINVPRMIQADYETFLKYRAK